MAYSRKPLSENEKKAKLKVLGEANSMAKKAMSSSMKSYKYKDSPELKKHTKEMSDESGMDFKEDSDRIVDPTHYGNVVGRHVSDENIDCGVSDSEYNLDELDAKIKKLMEQKAKIKG